jgi:predicted GIY-YIG superfamily endonuclease
MDDQYYNKVRKYTKTFKIIHEEIQDFDCSLKLFEYITNKIPIPYEQENQDDKDAFTIYILELEDSKYYVGRTNDLEKRLKEHENKSACSWTELYKLKKCLSSKLTRNEFEEENETLRMMSIHGIDSVRGATYCNVELLQHEKKMLSDRINHLQNRCFKCGSQSHFASACIEQRKKNNISNK